MSSDVATARIKGPAGTQVRLEVVDPDDGRAAHARRSRASEDRGAGGRGPDRERDGQKLGVVELTTFSKGAHGQLRQEIDRLLDAAARRASCSTCAATAAGCCSEAVLVSSIFIEDGLITFTKGRTQPRREFEAEGEAIAGDIPVVVLVDRGSASASEIVTGALRDRKRATVVGTRTFGKGVFQEVEPLSNGGVLDITVGEYYLPERREHRQEGRAARRCKAADDPETERDEALPIALKTLAGKATT